MSEITIPDRVITVRGLANQGTTVVPGAWLVHCDANFWDQHDQWFGTFTADQGDLVIATIHGYHNSGEEPQTWVIGDTNTNTWVRLGFYLGPKTNDVGEQQYPADPVTGGPYIGQSVVVWYCYANTSGEFDVGVTHIDASPRLTTLSRYAGAGVPRNFVAQWCFQPNGPIMLDLPNVPAATSYCESSFCVHTRERFPDVNGTMSYTPGVGWLDSGWDVQNNRFEQEAERDSTWGALEYRVGSTAATVEYTDIQGGDIPIWGATVVAYEVPIVTANWTDGFNRPDGGLGEDWVTVRQYEDPGVAGLQISGNKVSNDVGDWSYGFALQVGVLSTQENQYISATVSNFAEDTWSLGVMVSDIPPVGPDSPLTSGYWIDWHHNESGVYLYRGGDFVGLQVCTLPPLSGTHTAMLRCVDGHVFFSIDGIDYMDYDDSADPLTLATEGPCQAFVIGTDHPVYITSADGGHYPADTGAKVETQVAIDVTGTPYTEVLPVEEAFGGDGFIAFAISQGYRLVVEYADVPVPDEVV